MPDARAYHSPRRERQAIQTKADILSVARRLFSERGYAATSMNDIAAAAAVSVPTVYASVGSKAEIALSLVPFISAEVDMAALAADQFTASTALEVLRANARLTRVLNEQCGDIIRSLLSAGASDPDVAPAAAEGRRVHREGCRMVVERIHSMEALAEDLTVERAAAVLATVTSPDAIERLTIEHAWSYDEVEAWLAEALAKLLLRPASTRRRSRRP
jgi:AcrR family transcriptional regulator